MQQNKSMTEFILLGLTQDPKKQKMVFVIFIFYVGTLGGNLLIIVTIKSSQTHGSPMYFFLFYLSLVDACFSTSIAPGLIADSLSKKKITSYNWVPYSGLCTAFIQMHGDLCPHPQGHGSPRGHLQALELPNYHEAPGLHHPDCCCMDRVFYIFYGSGYPGLVITFLWIQFDWSLLLWYAAPVETCLHGYLCDESPGGI